MISVAVVEDDDSNRETLLTYLDQVSCDVRERFVAEGFESGEAFLERFRDQFDVLILDIQLDGIDGMRTAERVREFGSEAVIVFVTNLASYAIRGYAVSAFDYVMKPVPYDQFLAKMRRVLARVHAVRPMVIQIKSDGVRALSVDEILYIEVRGRKTVFHMLDGDTFECREPLSSLESRLPADRFFRCHVSIIVNVRYVGRVQGGLLFMRGREIPVARSKKASLLDFMTLYWGESM